MRTITDAAAPPCVAGRKQVFPRALRSRSENAVASRLVNDRRPSKRYLIVDRDSQYSVHFRRLITDTATKVYPPTAEGGRHETVDNSYSRDSGDEWD